MVRTIIQTRCRYYSQSTISSLLIEGNEFGYILEDTVRPSNIKVYGATAIPINPNGYRVGIRYSNKFNREVLILYTEDDKSTIKVDDLTFTYVYVHSGNRHDDTEGCLLANQYIDDTKGEAYGTNEKAIFNLIKPWIIEGDNVRWCVFNNEQV